MQMMKWSVMALAIAAATTQLAYAVDNSQVDENVEKAAEIKEGSSQAKSNGFIEDSSLNILSRNLYINRDYHRGGSAADYNNASSNPAGYTAEWGQGFVGMYESGFTEGTVGFGVDTFGMLGIRLDSGKGRAGILEMQQDHDGRTSAEYGESGAAVKARISESVLKYGNQFVALPVFSTDDSRLLPETTTGTLLTSSEIEGLEINAGHFTALNQQWETNTDSSGMKSLNLLGGSYSFTDELSASLYASDLEDAFKKTYANANYAFPLSDERSVSLDFNIYHTDYDKDYVQAATTVEDDDGNITDPGVRESRENTIWSLAAGYTFGAHTLTLAHQRNSGNAGYDYGADGGGTIWLANSIQVKDFNAEDETSWQARYDLDMSSFGVPGLSFMSRYVAGDNATLYDGTTKIADDASRWERNFEATYVVQAGAAKDLSLRLRQATVRSDEAFGSANDLDEVRLIVEYPLSIL